MRTTGLALLCGVAFLAGCGGSGGNGGGAGGGTTTRPKPPNGEASKPATQVLADAQKAAVGASSLHVTGNIALAGTPATLDLWLAKKGAKGSMTSSGLRFDLIRIGGTIYIRGSSAFLEHYARGAARILQGRWLKASATKGELASLAPLTSPGSLFGAIGKHHGKLVNDGLTTYKGRKAVEIRDTSDNSKLYVAATGTAYPIAVVGGKKSESGTIAFGSWNQPVSLGAPEHAITFSGLGAG